MRNDRALVFDFNGTLFWDTLFNIRAWSAISERWRNAPYSEEEQASLNGRNSYEIARFFLGARGEDRRLVDAVVEEKEELYRSLCLEDGKPSLAPGAEALIREAKESHCPIAIATGAPKSNLEAYRRWFPLLSLFGSNILYDDGTIYRGKPEPDIFLAAMRQLGVERENTVIFEDSVSGIRSAKASGAKTVYGITSPHCDRKGMEREFVPLLPDFNAFPRD